MATNTVVGNLALADGTNIPLKTEIAEGSEASLQTNSVYTVTQMDVGDYKPGGVVVAGLVTAEENIAYCYILSQGLVAALIPVGIRGVTAPQPALLARYTLKAGDIVKVRTNTSSDRECALSVFTNRGVSRIFSATPGSGTTTQLKDLQTGNDIGATLFGQVVTRACCTTIDDKLIETGGVAFVDALGNVIGSVSTTNPLKFQPTYSTLSAPIALNYVCEILTSA